MIGASLACRTTSGGVALARPFTGANLDVTTGPAASVSLTTFSQTTTNAQYALGSSESGAGFYVGTNSLSGQLIRYANTNPGEPTNGAAKAYRMALYPNGGGWIDCDSDLPLYNQGTNISAPGYAIRVRVATDINAQRGNTGSGGAIDMPGLIKNCDVSGTAVDGFWPGYNNGSNTTPCSWSVVEESRAIGATFNYYGGHLYGGNFPYDGGTNPNDAVGGADAVSLAEPNKAQIIAATAWPTGGAIPVTNGEMITVAGGPLGSGLYQVVTAGTLGTETPAGSWPGSTGTSAQATASKWDTITTSAQSTPLASPFTSGTAQLVFVGGAFHSDAGQTNDRCRIAMRFGMAADFANSCFLLQNSSGNTNALPVMNAVYEDYILRGGGNYDFYVQTQTGDNTSTLQSGFTPSSKKAGGFIRNADASWSISPSNPGAGDATNLLANSRPWHVSFRRNQHLTATSSLSPRLGTFPTFGQVLSSDGALTVASEGARDAGIAAQYGWNLANSATQLTLAQMRDGTYDYTTMPAPVSAALEARYQALCSNTSLQTNQAMSVSPGAMDARTWIVWEPSVVGKSTITSAGTSLTPHGSSTVPVPASQVDSNGHPLTDANGYYVGS